MAAQSPSVVTAAIVPPIATIAHSLLPDSAFRRSPLKSRRTRNEMYLQSPPSGTTLATSPDLAALPRTRSRLGALRLAIGYVREFDRSMFSQRPVGGDRYTQGLQGVGSADARETSVAYRRDKVYGLSAIRVCEPLDKRFIFRRG